jgi:hypothetical protein
MPVPVDVQDGLLTAWWIEPRTGKAKIGAVTLDQAEQAAVEVERLVAVFGSDGEVVHAVDHA